MAEGSSDCSEATVREARTLDGLPLDMVSGQFKSESEEFIQFDEVANPKEGKNRLLLVCKHCRCEVMKDGYGTLVENEIFMPYMTVKQKIGSEPQGETLTSFWLVEDMYHFENVGFSKVVNECEQYLLCADCEIGPIGWTNTNNRQQLFVAAERVMYARS